VFYSLDGWKNALFGGKHVHGPESINFFSRPKVVTSRSPHRSHASFHFPNRRITTGQRLSRPLTP